MTSGEPGRHPNPNAIFVQVPTVCWVDVIHILDLHSVQYEYDKARTDQVQVSFEKFDRRTELFGVLGPNGKEFSLAELSNPNVVGPAWKKQTERFLCREGPGRFADTRSYTWEQFAKILFEILLAHHDGQIVPLCNQTLLFPEPLKTYFEQRVRIQLLNRDEPPMTQPIDAMESQPQLSRPQIEQMYDAFYWVGRFRSTTTVPTCNDVVPACKILLMCYKMRGFYPRETRNYQMTGRNGFSRGTTRNWKDEKTREIFNASNATYKAQDAIIRDTNGEPMQHTANGPYRGKKPMQQCDFRTIYQAVNQRRNIDDRDNGVHLAESERRKKRMRCDSHGSHGLGGVDNVPTNVLPLTSC